MAKVKNLKLNKQNKIENNKVNTIIQFPVFLIFSIFITISIY